MARITVQKTTRKSVRPTRKRVRRPARSPSPFTIRRLLLYGALLGLLVASISVAGYVIFFRVVVAAEMIENPASILTVGGSERSRQVAPVGVEVSARGWGQ